MRPQAPKNTEGWYPYSYYLSQGREGSGFSFNIAKDKIYSYVLDKYYSPSQLFIYVDSVTEPTEAGKKANQSSVIFVTNNGTQQKVHARHAKRANCWYADGSVRAADRATLIDQGCANETRISMLAPSM